MHICSMLLICIMYMMTCRYCYDVAPSRFVRVLVISFDPQVDIRFMLWVEQDYARHLLGFRCRRHVY